MDQNKAFFQPSGDMSRGPPRVQQQSGVFIFNGRDLARMAHVTFLRPLSANRHAGHAVRAKVPEVRPGREAGKRLCLLNGDIRFQADLEAQCLQLGEKDPLPSTCLPNMPPWLNPGAQTSRILAHSP